MKKSKGIAFLLAGICIYVAITETSENKKLRNRMAFDGQITFQNETATTLFAIPSRPLEAIFSSLFVDSKLQGYAFFILLVLQCGCHPLLVKLFMPTSMVRSTAILGQEASKFLFSIFFLATSGQFRESLSGWKLTDAIVAAGLPAALFVVQNYCNLMANQVLPPVTFLIINQLKTLSTAWCCFIFLGQKQSQVQVMALVLLVLSTLVVQKVVPLSYAPSELKGQKSTVAMNTLNETKSLVGDIETTSQESYARDEKTIETAATETSERLAAYEEAGRQLTMGIMPALFASFLSGLAAMLTQRTLQKFQRSPHVFNMELSIFSSSFILMSLAAGTPDAQRIKENGIKQGWTWKALVPIISNSLGGILVGMVTKYQGAVVKSFALIFGMVVSGILQEVILAKHGGGVTREQVAGAALGGLSLYLHASFPVP